MKALLTLLLCSTLFLACESQPNNVKLIGTWMQVNDSNSVLQFEDSNVLLYTIMGQIQQTNYSIVQDTLLQLGVVQFVIKELNEDKLTITRRGGLSIQNPKTYTRTTLKLTADNLNRIASDTFANGQLKYQGEMVNGFHHGLWKEWYENGQLKRISNYNMERPAGEFKEWYSNGQLKSTKKMINGYLIDESRTWYENGQLQEVCTYDVNGDIISIKRWTKDGIEIKDE